jgi:hypothetical protein
MMPPFSTLLMRSDVLSDVFMACLELWLSFSFVLLVTLTLSFSVQAENGAPSEAPSEAQVKKADVKKENSWWHKRQQRSDIFYPHKPHMDIMKNNGDACMLCHPFSKNNVHDENTLEQLRQINNEPLKAICHDCHVEKMDAPSECRLCHPEPSSIWPQNHNYDYKTSHKEDVLADQDGCSECHKSLSFCADCHFKRASTGSKVHRLGYITLHGLDARIAPADCGSCHQANYCSDCHRRIK